MTRWDDDAEDDEDGDGDEPEVEPDDDDATIPCPRCRRAIFDDSERCPHCGRYLTREDAPPARKPWWIVLGAIAGGYALLRWLLP